MQIRLKSIKKYVNYRQANVCTIRVVVHDTQIMVSFEKVSGHNFFKLSLKIIHSYGLCT